MTVDIKGLVQRLPSKGVLRKEWEIEQRALKLFGQQNIYIAAETLEVQSEATQLGKI